MWQATSEALVLFQMHVVSLLISKICSRNGTRPDTQDEKISQDAVQHAFAGLCVTSSVMAELSSDVNEQLKLIRLHFPDSLLTDCRYRDWIPGEPQPSHLPGQLKEHQSHASCFKDLIIVPVPIGEIYSHFLFQGHNRKWEKMSLKKIFPLDNFASPPVLKTETFCIYHHFLEVPVYFHLTVKMFI